MLSRNDLPDRRKTKTSMRTVILHSNVIRMYEWHENEKTGKTVKIMKEKNRIYSVYDWHKIHMTPSRLHYKVTRGIGTSHLIAFETQR